MTDKTNQPVEAAVQRLMGLAHDMSNADVLCATHVHTESYWTHDANRTKAKERLTDALRAELTRPVGVTALGLKPPKLNYTLLHAFASTHHLSYNDLCTVVRDSIIATPPGGAGGSVGADHEKQMLEAISQRDHREEIIDALCDAVLGEDRTEWSSAYYFEDAVAEVQERMGELEARAGCRESQGYVATRAPEQATPQDAAPAVAVEHGQLDPRTATASAKLFLAYVEAYNGEKFSPVFDTPDRQNLAMALDHLQEAGAMILNLAERVAASSVVQPTPGQDAKDARPVQDSVHSDSGDRGEVQARSDTAYALEHAEYMAKDGERLINAINDLARAESEHGDGQANESDVIAAGNTLSEALVSLRGGIYEFRKRRDRAILSSEKPPASGGGRAT